MKINILQRKKLEFYLQSFYNSFSDERFTIFHFVKYFKKRLRNNRDAWMGVSGETGTGKSYFVIMSQILFGRPYDLQKNVSYIPRGDEIIQKFSKLKFNTFLIDEAAKEMRSVNWHSKSQQDVNVAAMTERFKNNWVFLNMPNFNEFTKSMRQTNIIFRAIVLFRTDLYARIVIQRKSRNWRSDDPWGDKLANDKYEKIDKKKRNIDNDLILDIERSLPNTVMDFIVPNLELILPEITTEYNRLKLESRKSPLEIKPLNKMEVKYKDKYDELLKKVTRILVNNKFLLGSKQKVSRGEMASELGISPDTFRKSLRTPLKGEIVPSFRKPKSAK